MKSFYEAFPSVKCEGELNYLFQLAGVERVTAPPDMRYVKIFIVLPRLVENKVIREMEAYLKKSLFCNRQTEVILSERFELSSQYNPENLYDAYKDSILTELRDRKMLEYRILQKSSISFTDDSLTYTIEDTEINRHLEKELSAYLKSIFNDRCGIPCRIIPQYIEAEISKIPDDVNDFAELVTVKKQEEYIDVSDAGSWTVVL